MALNLTVQGVSGNTPSAPSATSAPSSVASSPQPTSPLKPQTPSSTSSTPAQSNQGTPTVSPRLTQRSASFAEEKPITRSLSESASSNENGSVSDLTPTQPFVVKVAFDFKATSEDELELKQGQSVTVVDSNHPEWWLGEVVGTTKQGYFPSFYVFVEEEKKEDPLAWTYKATVLYDYTKQEDNELSVTKGDVLVIYKTNDTEEW